MPGHLHRHVCHLHRHLCSALFAGSLQKPQKYAKENKLPAYNPMLFLASFGTAATVVCNYLKEEGKVREQLEGRCWRIADSCAESAESASCWSGLHFASLKTRATSEATLVLQHVGNEVS
eukprot:SAG31_NODE_102_length_25175_cov_10.778553_11_plen_120_part_00